MGKMDALSMNDRATYPNAASQLRKGLAAAMSGQDSSPQSLENDTLKSMGGVGRSGPDASSSQQTVKKKTYTYCIDTN